MSADSSTRMVDIWETGLLIRPYDLDYFQQTVPQMQVLGIAYDALQGHVVLFDRVSGQQHRQIDQVAIDEDGDPIIGLQKSPPAALAPTEIFDYNLGQEFLVRAILRGSVLTLANAIAEAQTLDQFSGARHDITTLLSSLPRPIFTYYDLKMERPKRELNFMRGYIRAASRFGLRDRPEDSHYEDMTTALVKGVANCASVIERGPRFERFIWLLADEGKYESNTSAALNWLDTKTGREYILQKAKSDTRPLHTAVTGIRGYFEERTKRHPGKVVDKVSQLLDGDGESSPQVVIDVSNRYARFINSEGRLKLFDGSTKLLPLLPTNNPKQHLRIAFKNLHLLVSAYDGQAKDGEIEMYGSNVEQYLDAIK